MRLDGRVIIVTGAAQGIGRAIAEQAVAAGARVAALDHDISPLTASDALLPIACDVADPAAVEAAVARVAEWGGPIDGLVNNAGISQPAMIDRMTLEEWRAVIDVNLSGSFHLIQSVGRRMIADAKAGVARDRAIVNIASDAGRGGTIGQVNYGASKAGVIGLAMSAAREWARHGIRVNVVSFGVVATAMTRTVRAGKLRDSYLAQIPLGRFAEPDEVARPVIFLLSDAASYITGQTLSVNGGYRIAA